MSCFSINGARASSPCLKAGASARAYLVKWAGGKTQLLPFVIAHELGHAVCTPDANTSWISAYTLALNTDRIEREANTFAVELLLPDSFIRENEGCSIYQLARLRGVPEELVGLKGIA